MTKTRRVKISAIILIVLVVITIWALLLAGRIEEDHSLALVFERYGTTWDDPDEIMAFLQFTNASDKAYGLSMTGGTNTFQQNSPIGRLTGSYLVKCEFSDQTESMQPVSFASLGVCRVVEPHSAVRVRVPLPPGFQNQRVAVLCAEMPSGKPKQFWTQGIGLGILRTLPRSLRLKLFFEQPAVLRVWCDHELPNPDDSPPIDELEQPRQIQ